jgi:hypothetical protein
LKHPGILNWAEVWNAGNIFFATTSGSGEDNRDDIIDSNGMRAKIADRVLYRSLPSVRLYATISSYPQANCRAKAASTDMA